MTRDKRTNTQIEAKHVEVRAYLRKHRRAFSGAQMGRDLGLSGSAALLHLRRLVKDGEVVRSGRYGWKPAQPGSIEDSTARIVQVGDRIEFKGCDEPTTEKGKRVQAMVKKYGWDATVDMIEAFGMGR
jgi:hypothetical protein